MKKSNAAGSAEVFDPDDAPELTEEMLDHAEVWEGDVFIRRGPVWPLPEGARESVSFRLDRDVLAKLREAGPGWQVTVNELLRTALRLGNKPSSENTAPAAPRKRARAAS